LGTVLLVQVDPDVAVRLRGAGGLDEDESFEELGGPGEVPARLRRHDGALDALVIESRLEDAVALASRAHARDPDLSMLILLEAAHEEARRPNGQMGPLPRSHAEFRALSEDRDLTDALRSAVAATRERRTRAAGATEPLDPLIRAEIETERSRLEALFHHAPVPAGWLWGPNHVVEYANPLALELFGGSHRRLLGTKPRDSVPEVSGQGYFELLDHVFSSGDPFVGRELPVRLNRYGDGLHEGYYTFIFEPTRDGSGQVNGILLLGVEVTEQAQARDRIQELVEAAALEKDELLAARDQALLDAEAARSRLQFLLEASTVLGASLNFPETLDRLARLATSSLADLCLIDIVEENGVVTRMAAVHADPEKQSLADLLRDRYAPDPTGPHPAVRVMQTGEALHATEMPEEFLRDTTRDDEHFRVVRELGFQSYMCVPLRARGRTIGAITLVSTRPDHRYGPADLTLARDLAWRAALAVDNARLYRDRTHVARTLQASLLPRDLPSIPGAEISARYLVAGEGNEVGGDFYDLYETGDGGWAVVIGDVCGKGAEAAAVTGQARYTLRAASMRQRRPSKVLETLNEAMLAQRSDMRFCTVTYVRLRPTDYGARATVACGGHPAALVLRAGGSIERVGKPGTLVGIFPDPEIGDEMTDLRPGDSLILYTDGVIARAHGDMFTEERLHEVLAGAAGLGAAELAARIEGAVLEFQAGDLRDDLAILVVRLTD